ncbi:hypothetical protein WJX79_005021 [Trebouxia sp. C0005]
MVMRGNYSAVTLSNPSDDFASVLTCVILCMPLSSQIERKRKRSTGAAWNRTLEGSAFAECPICSRRVALATINSHLESASCQTACAQQQVANPVCPSGNKDIPVTTKTSQLPVQLEQPTASSTLPGEYCVPDFVTEQEELHLLHMLDACSPLWQDKTFNGKHRGKRWGVEMDLGQRTVVEGVTPLAAELHMLIARMQQLPCLCCFQPNEANAIDYRKDLGHWLKPHVDDRQLSTDKIVTLSLAGLAVMTFTSKKGHSVDIELPPRTLQIITKDARYMYTHGIGRDALLAPRRVSITFRQSPLKAKA